MLTIIFTLGVIVGGAVATVGWALWADRAMRSGQMSGYPDGCTQAMHDAAHQSYTPDESNAIREELDWRAEQEVQDCAQPFVDWLMDRDDIGDLSRMIAFYKSGRMTDCRTIVDNIVSDYQQYRVATLSADEENDIAEALNA